MRSAPKKGASRWGGGGESMNDEDICSCTVALRDKHGLSLWDLSPSAPRPPLPTIWCRATTQSTEDASAAKGIPGAHQTSAPIPPVTSPPPPPPPPPPPRSFLLSFPLRRRRPCQSADDRTAAAAAAPPGAYACEAAADVHPSPRSAAEANPFRLPSSAAGGEGDSGSGGGGDDDEPSPRGCRRRRRIPRRRSAAGERSPAMRGRS